MLVWILEFNFLEFKIMAEHNELGKIGEELAVDFGSPQDFVKPKKIKLLVKAINEYVISNDLDVEVRFDIIAIHSKGKEFEIEHLEEAFYYFDN